MVEFCLALMSIPRLIMLLIFGLMWCVSCSTVLNLVTLVCSVVLMKAIALDLFLNPISLNLSFEIKFKLTIYIYIY